MKISTFGAYVLGLGISIGSIVGCGDNNSQKSQRLSLEKEVISSNSSDLSPSFLEKVKEKADKDPEYKKSVKDFSYDLLDGSVFDIRKISPEAPKPEGYVLNTLCFSLLQGNEAKIKYAPYDSYTPETISIRYIGVSPHDSSKRRFSVNGKDYLLDFNESSLADLGFMNDGKCALTLVHESSQRTSDKKEYLFFTAPQKGGQGILALE